MAGSTSEAISEVVVERTLEYTDGDVARPVTVRICRPVRRDAGEWTCTVEIDGLLGAGDAFTQQGCGPDSAQALFLALEIAGTEIKRHKDVRPAGEWRSGAAPNPWPIRMEPMWLPVPDPLPHDVIVTRTLDIAGFDGVRHAQVTVHRPEPHSAREWQCRYTITDLDEPGDVISQYACGADSAQALFLAIQIIGVHIGTCEGVSWGSMPPWEAVGSIPDVDPSGTG